MFGLKWWPSWFFSKWRPAIVLVMSHQIGSRTPRRDTYVGFCLYHEDQEDQEDQEDTTGNCRKEDEYYLRIYAPQVGCSDDEKLTFWEELDDVLQSIPDKEGLVVIGDFNGHVGMERADLERWQEDTVMAS